MSIEQPPRDDQPATTRRNLLVGSAALLTAAAAGADDPKAKAQPITVRTPAEDAEVSPRGFTATGTMNGVGAINGYVTDGAGLFVPAARARTHTDINAWCLRFDESDKLKPGTPNLKLVVTGVRAGGSTVQSPPRPIRIGAAKSRPSKAVYKKKPGEKSPTVRVLRAPISSPASNTTQFHFFVAEGTYEIGCHVSEAYITDGVDRGSGVELIPALAVINDYLTYSVEFYVESPYPVPYSFVVIDAEDHVDMRTGITLVTS